MRCTVAFTSDRWAVAEGRNSPQVLHRVRFQLAAVITSFVFIAEAFDNPVLQQIMFLFHVGYIFLFGPLYVSSQTTVK